MNPSFVIKVCGITSVDDGQAALDAGANALGFNFYSRSSRFITFDQAASLMARLRGNFLRVGVFVHPGEQDLHAASSLVDVAQVHGDGPALLRTWRATTAGSRPPADPRIEAWLLDNFSPEFGGSGQTFDWNLAANFPHRVIVAGGLHGANVADAIRALHPWGVDACSRLESSPGRKDHHQVQAFVASALAAFQVSQTVQT